VREEVGNAEVRPTSK